MTDNRAGRRGETAVRGDQETARVGGGVPDRTCRAALDGRGRARTGGACGRERGTGYRGPDGPRAAVGSGSGTPRGTGVSGARQPVTAPCAPPDQLVSSLAHVFADSPGAADVGRFGVFADAVSTDTDEATGGAGVSRGCGRATGAAGPGRRLARTARRGLRPGGPGTVCRTLGRLAAVSLASPTVPAVSVACLTTKTGRSNTTRSRRWRLWPAPDRLLSCLPATPSGTTRPRGDSTPAQRGRSSRTTGDRASGGRASSRRDSPGTPQSRAHPGCRHRRAHPARGVSVRLEPTTDGTQHSYRSPAGCS